jgi:hypothetical protein
MQSFVNVNIVCHQGKHRVEVSVMRAKSAIDQHQAQLPADYFTGIRTLKP